MIRHLNTTVDARCEDDIMTLLHITYISYRQLNTTVDARCEDDIMTLLHITYV